MTVNKVHVRPTMLNWAVQRSGLPVEALERRFALNKWIAETEKPTFRQIEAFARATGTPLGFLFLSTPPADNLGIPYYRTVEDKDVVRPSANLVETVRMMEARQDWLREYLFSIGSEPMNIPPTPPNPVDAARSLRGLLGLSVDWMLREASVASAVRMLKRSAERAGIIVVINGIVGNNTHRVLNPTEFRGFVLVDEYAPLIFVNGNDAKQAQLFTMAHELAHILYRKSAAFDLRDFNAATNSVERLCNQVAAEFVVPRNEFLDLFRATDRNYESFHAATRRFKVSVLVLLRRAQELQVIDKATFWRLYEIYQQSMGEPPRRNRDGGGDYYKNQEYRVGRPFFLAVARATQEGSLPLLEGYRLTGLWGRSFDRYADVLAKEDSR